MTKEEILLKYLKYAYTPNLSRKEVSEIKNSCYKSMEEYAELKVYGFVNWIFDKYNIKISEPDIQEFLTNNK